MIDDKKITNLQNLVVKDLHVLAKSFDYLRTSIRNGIVSKDDVLIHDCINYLAIIIDQLRNELSNISEEEVMRIRYISAEEFIQNELMRETALEDEYVQEGKKEIDESQLTSNFYLHAILFKIDMIRTMMRTSLRDKNELRFYDCTNYMKTVSKQFYDMLPIKSEDEEKVIFEICRKIWDKYGLEPSEE